MRKVDVTRLWGRSDQPRTSPASETHTPHTWSKLDAAKVALQVVANIADGAVNVPGLQSIANLVIQIIDVTKKVKSNKKDCIDLTEFIVELLQPITEALKGHEGADVSPALVNDLRRFETALKKVWTTLEGLHGRRRLSRIVSHERDGESIAKCKDLIDQAYRTFNMYAFIDIRRNVEGMKIQQAEMAKPKVTDDLFTAPCPLAPEVFFGREDYIANIISLVRTKDSVRTAVLGPGGIGKTAVALHILHHPEIVQVYKDYRYFVACDALTSADMLVTELLKVLHVKQLDGQDCSALLIHHLASAPPCMIILDNFETPWEHPQEQMNLVRILQILVKKDKSFLLVTMRGTTNPSGIQWTTSSQSGVLHPLSSEEARSLFLAINPVCMNVSNGSDDLDLLLKQLDYVPLAIHLIAQAGQGFSCAYLLACWEKEKTSMLKIDDVEPTRLQSVDVSISITLNSTTLSANPQAVVLLALLCHLPDGLNEWETRLAGIAPSLFNVQYLLRILQKVALTYIQEGAIRVLSPIRHHVLAKNVLSKQHMVDLETFYFDLVDQCAVIPTNTSFPSCIALLEPEVNNVTYLIMKAIEHTSEVTAIRAALQLSRFLLKTRPSESVLAAVLPHLDGVLIDVKAEVYMMHGDIFRMQDRYKEAADKLTEAQWMYASIGHQLGVAQCMQRLGNILHWQNRDEEAAGKLTEAYENFVSIGHRRGAAQCLQNLGDILCMQHRFPEAVEKLKEAQEIFVTVRDQSGVGQCLKSIGVGLQVQDRYEEATAKLMEAQEIFVGIGNQRGIAQCMQRLGNILYIQNRYQEAVNNLTEAQEIFMSIGNQLGAAICLQSLGNILVLENRYKEAADKLTEAQQIYMDIGNEQGVNECVTRMEEVTIQMHSK